MGEGTATFTAQPAEGLEYAHKITVEDARISWTDEAEAIDRQVRACTPHPGAWTELFAEGPIADNDEPAAKPLTLHILAAQPADQSNPNTPAELQPGELKVGKKNVCWYRQHAAGTHPSQGAGQEGHARRRLGPRRAPLPRRLRAITSNIAPARKHSKKPGIFARKIPGFSAMQSAIS